MIFGRSERLQRLFDLTSDFDTEALRMPLRMPYTAL